MVGQINDNTSIARGLISDYQRKALRLVVVKENKTGKREGV